ncbi:DinB family protein [Neolewinella litorea]|uniref:DinB family protein n=1 Tax=Neolewinella litorea TaxID=2562452 RepID=A0A4V3XLA0_9BACT|nr:DinB family protein [Neolewinella litorea]THH40033.1 DinB family protein [Neolewinella litorea]
MQYTSALAHHVRTAFAGDNWTSVGFREKLADLTWQQATTRLGDHNSIAALVYHVGYYYTGMISVLRGGALEIPDKFSFDHPAITDEEDWRKLVNDTYAHVATFADLVEALPDERLADTFTDEKYGTVWRNLLGVLEHTYYHLGQISLLKKLIHQHEAA